MIYSASIVPRLINLDLYSPFRSLSEKPEFNLQPSILHVNSESRSVALKFYAPYRCHHTSDRQRPGGKGGLKRSRTFYFAVTIDCFQRKPPAIKRRRTQFGHYAEIIPIWKPKIYPYRVAMWRQHLGYVSLRTLSAKSSHLCRSNQRYENLKTVMIFPEDSYGVNWIDFEAYCEGGQVVPGRDEKPRPLATQRDVKTFLGVNNVRYLVVKPLYGQNGAYSWRLSGHQREERERRSEMPLFEACKFLGTSVVYFPN